MLYSVGAALARLDRSASADGGEPNERLARVERSCARLDAALKLLR